MGWLEEARGWQWRKRPTVRHWDLGANYGRLWTWVQTKVHGRLESLGQAPPATCGGTATAAAAAAARRLVLLGWWAAGLLGWGAAGLLGGF